MRVVVAFHDLQALEALDLGDAFWLADTPINRTFAEKAWATNSVHPNSAVFDWDSGSVEDDDILERIGDINMHQPHWSEIQFLSVDLTSDLRAQIEEIGVTAQRQTNGFHIKR